MPARVGYEIVGQYAVLDLTEVLDSDHDQSVGWWNEPRMNIFILGEYTHQ